jgi:hypothetical protein
MTDQQEHPLDRILQDIARLNETKEELVPMLSG